MVGPLLMVSLKLVEHYCTMVLGDLMGPSIFSPMKPSDARLSGRCSFSSLGGDHEYIQRHLFLVGLEWNLILFTIFQGIRKIIISDSLAKLLIQ